MAFKEKLDSVFRLTEDIIYILISLLLILTALFIMVSSVLDFFPHLSEIGHLRAALHILDRILLTLMIIEILYTVRLSIKSHSLCAEPFIIVGLIAAIRRILVITVESAHLPEKFNHHMIESAILGGLILIFVISIVLLRKGEKSS